MLGQPLEFYLGALYYHQGINFNLLPLRPPINAYIWYLKMCMESMYIN